MLNQAGARERRSWARRGRARGELGRGWGARGKAVGQGGARAAGRRPGQHEWYRCVATVHAASHGVEARWRPI
eukprot:9507828-Alexandrium_andersonii.AAC.1